MEVTVGPNLQLVREVDCKPRDLILKDFGPGWFPAIVGTVTGEEGRFGLVVMQEDGRLCRAEICRLAGRTAFAFDDDVELEIAHDLHPSLSQDRWPKSGDLFLDSDGYSICAKFPGMAHHSDLWSLNLRTGEIVPVDVAPKARFDRWTVTIRLKSDRSEIFSAKRLSPDDAA